MKTHRDFGTFELESWGGGVAYSLTHKPSSQQVFVQDNATLRFENDMKATEAAFPE